MSLPQPDLGVLRKAQRGDERAFSLIVRAYELPVYNYVLRLVGDRSLAEDLTQEVFLRVYQGLPSFSLRCRFTTWLFQVTKNRVLDELRALERRPRAVVNLEDIPPLEVVDAPFERIEAIDAVWRAVEHLSTDLKMALLLRDVVGLSYTEIADSLEVTLATVKWRIYKAREEVQLALGREGITFATTGEQPAEPAARLADSRAARRRARAPRRTSARAFPPGSRSTRRAPSPTTSSSSCKLRRHPARVDRGDRVRLQRSATLCAPHGSLGVEPFADRVGAQRESCREPEGKPSRLALPAAAGEEREHEYERGATPQRSRLPSRRAAGWRPSLP